MDKRPLISVIVPVWNVEDYIRQAVESVLKQTEPRFELLLIDDGSTDGSGAIADEYAGKDPRVKVFHTENRGVSAARNRGMDEARGEWLFFLDGDDWLEENALETLLARSVGMDLVAARHETEGTPFTGVMAPAVFDMSRATPDMLAELRRSRLHMVVWNRLYRKSRVSLRFNEDMDYSEDVAFIAELIPGLEKICCIPEVTYHYRRRRGSAVTRLNYSDFENRRRAFRLLYALYKDCPSALAAESVFYAGGLHLHLSLLRKRLSGSKPLWNAMAGEWLRQCGEDRFMIRTECFDEELLRIWDLSMAGDTDALWDALADGGALSAL